MIFFVVLKPQRSFPGDNGRAVIVAKEKEAESKELFKINQFNLMASDMMSLNRTLPDYRMDAYAFHTVHLVLFIVIKILAML